MPGVKIPNFPFGGAMLTGLRIQFLPDSFEKCRAGFNRGFGARLIPSGALDGTEHSMMRHPAFFCKPNPKRANLEFTVLRPAAASEGCSASKIL
jgi:hypothetical protein